MNGDPRSLTGKRLLIIGDFNGLLDKSIDMGIEVFAELNKNDTANISGLENILICDYSNLPVILEVTKAIHRINPFDGVISLSEYGLSAAAHVAEALGLRCVPAEIVDRTRNKLRMREYLEERMFSPVQSRLAKKKSDVVEFAASVGYPVVLKPVDQAGSQDVIILEKEDDFPKDELRGNFMLEEYLDGPEFCVDCIAFDGRIHILAVNGEVKGDAAGNPAMEIGHFCPANISRAEHLTIEKFTVEFLRVIGLDNGPSHTEVKMTKKGPRIVETHNRLGGDTIPELVFRLTGYDPVRAAILWALGVDEPPQPHQTIKKGLAIRFFTPSPGVVKRITGLSRVIARPDVIRVDLPIARGHKMSSLTNAASRPGYVICSGASSAEAMAVCEQVISEVQIELEN